MGRIARYLAVDDGSDDLAGYSLIGVAQRDIDLLCVRRLAPLDLTLTCEGHGHPSLIRGRGRLLSLEEQDARREAWTSGDIDDLLCFEQHVRSLGERADAPLAILPYCATPGWEGLTGDQSLGARLAAIPMGLKRRLDDKGWVRSELTRLGIPVPSTVLVLTSDLNHAELVRHLGEPLVLQRRVGSSGQGTYLAQNEGDLARIRLTNPSVSTWVVSSYAGDCTVNVHGLVLESCVEVSIPSVQLTGVPDLAPSFGAYCGNDFGAAAKLSPSARAEVKALVRRTGGWLASLGYRGIFGVDISVGTTLHVLEINPRLQGSTWLLGEVELEAGAVPMAVAHFAHLLGLPVSGSRSEVMPAAAAQMLLTWRGEEPLRMKTSIRNGVYTLDGRDRLRFHRPDAGLLECESDEILIFGLPAVNQTTTIYPGAALARVATRTMLAGRDGRTLTNTGQRIVASLNARLMP